jgi:hypothetical protein
VALEGSIEACRSGPRSLRDIRPPPKPAKPIMRESATLLRRVSRDMSCM